MAIDESPKWPKMGQMGQHKPCWAKMAQMGQHGPTGIMLCLGSCWAMLPILIYVIFTPLEAIESENSIITCFEFFEIQGVFLAWPSLTGPKSQHRCRGYLGLGKVILGPLAHLWLILAQLFENRFDDFGFDDFQALRGH